MKVFISSSVYGQNNRRALIKDEIEEMGFTAILSEKNNFPLYNTLHSHDACLKVVEESDLLLLIIQKRYGQKYAGNLYNDIYKDISITHAEYRHAFRNRKKLLILCEDEIFNERHKWKANKTNYSGDIDVKIFELYDEITNQKKEGNWIYFFKEEIDCHQYIKNQLNNIKNETLAPPNKTLRSTFIRVPFKDMTKINEIAVSSYWKVICQSFDVVQKSWEIQICNNTSLQLILMTPLILPLNIEYKDLNVLKTGIQHFPNTNIQNRSVTYEIIYIENPVHSRVIKITPPIGGLIISSGEKIKLTIEFSHRNYFSKVGNCYINIGMINYLDYPDFKHLCFVQKVCKEFFIAKEMLQHENKLMGIDIQPRPDWHLSNKKFHVIGFGRKFEKKESLDIEILIK
jgi:hypothetical protein